ncbi:MAG: thioredoxin fold domain-containing protein [Gammaproteobacteria bacterium]|nr:thioredoxin fold domain-containing protein [Gammaproteobacteria bacterium]
MKSETPYIFETHYETFDKDVIQQSHQKPVLLDLWAEWCSPCLMVAPVLKQLIEDYDGAILLAKIEVDEGENMKVAGHNKVRGFPTIIFYQNGEEKARFSGAKPKHFINEMIQEHFEL